jgi:hypothetical protein
MYKQVDVTEGSRNSRVLVISAATGYKPNDLEPFLRSLYEHCPRATVVLSVNRQGHEYEEVLKNFNENVVLISLPDRYLRSLLWSERFRFCWRHGVFRKLVMYASTEFFSKLPAVGQQFTTSFLPINFARYFIAKKLLLGRYQDAEAVLLCDSRDVFFQGDPFACLRADLVSGLEDCKIKECPWTKQWIDRSYGYEALTRIGEQQVVCSGVTLGKRNAILAYLEAMCDEISKVFAKNVFAGGGDQGIHNWIIRTKRSINCHLIPAGHNLIATLNYADLEADYEFDEDRGLLNKKLEPVIIVHQYDRREVIRNWCLNRWAKLGIQ